MSIKEYSEKVKTIKKSKSDSHNNMITNQTFYYV
jgi:hypothetical protein